MVGVVFGIAYFQGSQGSESVTNSITGWLHKVVIVEAVKSSSPCSILLPPWLKQSCWAMTFISLSDNFKDVQSGFWIRQ